jgi:hypothetical protein
MKEGAFAAISLTGITCALLIALMWWRTRRHGVDRFWVWVERLGWVAGVLSAVLAVFAIVAVRDGNEIAGAGVPVAAESRGPVATAEPRQTTSAESTSSAVIEPSKTIYSDVPIAVSPLSCDVYNPAIDFDEPASYENYADDEAYKTADLWYETCKGSFEQRAGAFIGIGPPALPGPEDCAKAAKTRPIGSLDIRSVKVGDAFCVVTSNRQIAWAAVTRKGEPFLDTLNDGTIPTVEFTVTLWPAL